jgi:hypothetical protein
MNQDKRRTLENRARHDPPAARETARAVPSYLTVSDVTVAGVIQGILSGGVLAALLFFVETLIDLNFAIQANTEANQALLDLHQQWFAITMEHRR